MNEGGSNFACGFQYFLLISIITLHLILGQTNIRTNERKNEQSKINTYKSKTQCPGCSGFRIIYEE